MSFTLRVAGDRWRAHTESVRKEVSNASRSSFVPVIKSDGYGLGQTFLAEEAMRLEADTVCVGTVFEVDSLAAVTRGDIVVLEPFEARDVAAAGEWWRLGQRLYAGRVIRGIANVESLLALCSREGSARIVLEAKTSMHRFGFSESALLAALRDERVRHALATGRIFIEGLTLHLPMVQPVDEIAPRGVTDGTARAREVMRWAGLWQAETAVWSGHGAPANVVWVSHLDEAELIVIARSLDDTTLRCRIGSRLWLGDRKALVASGTVLAVHPLATGTHVGYRQRTGPKDGTLVVVSGGTAHGIGLTAPTPAASLRQRIVTAGTGALDAAGRALSPFTWAKKQRWFAEPPHQHHSMIWLPHDCVLPQIGDQFSADVRFTTSHFDAVIVD
jgi:Alanine racemase, N-terminal domain